MTGLPSPLGAPEFSSYDRDDVQWLLHDVSDRVVENTGLDRERHIQTTGHYSESLPVEYVPDEAYVALFDRALALTATSVARAAARVGDAIVVARPNTPTLVSLARAGTPAGILIKRWIKLRHGIDAPHFTMSIILDRGLDPVAIKFLTTNFDPSSVIFIDGWTGKGSISAELARSLSQLGSEAAGLSSGLAVLADPAGSARFQGTTNDVLIPTACLNSGVSGLVSRTMYSPELIPKGQFHGAKFYSELRHEDRSRDVIDTVSAEFASVGDPSDDSSGDGTVIDVKAELERIRQIWGVDRPGLIKPGICETTRVLLRRVPREILLRAADVPEVEHIQYLARVRGVPVRVDPSLAFAAVGLIQPIDSL